MKAIHVIVFDNCGNGNDEFELIRAYKNIDKANEECQRLNRIQNIIRKKSSSTGSYDIYTIDYYED